MSEQEIVKSDDISSAVECDIKDSNDDSSINDDSIATLSDRDESDNSDFMDADDAFSVCRDMVSEVANQSDALQTESQDFDNLKHELSDIFPNDFINVYKTLNEPKTMGGIVSLTDSDSGEEFDEENSNEPKCMVSSCTSRKRVKARSRLVTSYFGLSYMESPVVCHKCFIKAIAFYKKIAKITPSSMKFLVNDNFTKGTDCIDICDDDGPVPEVSPKMLEDDSLATDVARNIQSHVNKVAEEYNIDEKFNKFISKMEAKIGKMTIWINELNCKLDMDDQDMVSKLQQVYHSYEPQLKMLGEIDLGTVDADNPELSKRWDERELLPSGYSSDHTDKQSSTIVIDGTTDDPDIAIVEDTVASNLKKPSTLPPRGMIVRKKPSISQKMFVSRIGESNDWVMATVESVLMHEDASKVFTYKYKVKVLVNPASVYVKEVTDEDMAYYEPSPVRIPVGNRVISALYTKDENDPPKYYPGVVAECPSSNNQYRYLIFFDSMTVQYSNHEDLRITCKMKEHIYEYFPFNSRFFIKKYFEMLPKRKILTLNTMDIIKVEHNGHWVDAKVTAVDGLLMEVFYKQKEPTEWLYRGSPRVMYKEMYRNRLLKTLAENPNGQVTRYGVVAEDDPEEVALVRLKLRNKRQMDQQEQLQQQNTKVRAVARKTITRTSEEPSVQSQQPASTSIYQNRTGKDEFAGLIKVYKDLGANSLIPRDLGASHECSELCISWTNKTLDTCRGKNPLVIPMLFAFKRVDVMPMGGAARQIYYESPCSRRLEDFDQLLSYLQKTKCQLSVDYFNFDPWVSVWEEFKAATEGLLLKDLSYGKEFSPIPVVNTVDHDLPPFMNYMVMRKATDGVPLNLDTEFLTGCDCEDDCSNKSSCPCWQKTIKDYLDLIVTSNAEIDDSINLMDYSNIGYQNKRLVEYVSSGIYECNSTCKCSHTCLNRVVQLPLKVKLELFKTKHKGWGTRCLNDIPAGGFICVYVGNILTEKAANEDGKAYGDEYFAELDYIEVMERMMNKPGYESGPSDPENTDDEDRTPPEGKETPRDTRLRSLKKDDNKKTRLKRSTTDQARIRPHSGDNLPPATKPGDNQSLEDALNSSNSYIPLRLCYSNLYGAKESVYIIDAKTAGNIGRYFNHSCEPNIFVQNVFVDTHDLRFPWVAFFAKHHIRAGSELTWDYQYMVDSVPGKRLYCYCGSRNCRGRLL